MFTHTAPHNLPDLKTKNTPDGRRLYVTPEGNKYPSVTTVLGATSDKTWLEDWRTMLGPKKADKESKRCSDRGTAVHELVEHHLNNVEGFMRGYAPDHIKLFNQLKLRLKKVNNIRTQEAALWSDTLKIAGRVDCVGEFNGQLAIIDFKTSNNPKTEDMIFDYFLQCTAYALMWEERTGERIDHVCILMAVEKGLVSMVFQDSIDKYIEPLVQRITSYHKSRG
jgi:genome maintenance exonuclease 1